MKKQAEIIVLLTYHTWEPSDRKCAGLPDSLDFSSRTIVASTSSTPTTGSSNNSSEVPDVNNRGDFWTYSPSNATLTVDLSAGSSAIFLPNAVENFKKDNTIHRLWFEIGHEI